jgi:hypothetical protein
MGGKKRDLTLVLLPCWQCCSHIGRKWLAFALNALTFVCRQVGEEVPAGLTQGRPDRPMVVQVRDFSKGRGASSSGPHVSRNAVEGALSLHICGFSRVLWCEILGGFGYPWFRYPTTVLHHPALSWTVIS